MLHNFKKCPHVVFLHLCKINIIFLYHVINFVFNFLLIIIINIIIYISFFLFLFRQKAFNSVKDFFCQTSKQLLIFESPFKKKIRCSLCVFFFSIQFSQIPITITKSEIYFFKAVFLKMLVERLYFFFLLPSFSVPFKNSTFTFTSRVSFLRTAEGKRLIYVFRNYNNSGHRHRVLLHSSSELVLQV